MTRSNNPESSRHPENRRGTRSYRAFMSCMINPDNGFTACGTVLRASARQERKAMRLLDAGVHPKAVKGRVLRSVLRELLVSFGEECDSAYVIG